MQTVCGNPFFVDNVVAKTYHITEQFQKQKQKENTKNLKRLFSASFHELRGKIQITHKFCGLFGQTKNNLGLIGRLEKENHLLFSSSGANGIINAFCGVEIIEDILSGKKHQFEDIFSPLRKKMTISEFLSKVCTFQEIL